MKKLFFSKNLSPRICPKLGSDYPRGTCENVVYHFHGTIQTIIPSYLRPVFINEMQVSKFLQMTHTKSQSFDGG